MAHVVRVLDPDDLRAAHDLFGAALLFRATSDDLWERWLPTYSPGRTLGVDDGALIGTATSFPTRTAVPGGATLPTAAVTGVGVRADRTRCGVLTTMMRAQLDDVAARGEVLASLRASEARIYGRFGYGVATRGRGMRVRRGGAGWRAMAPRGGTVRMLGRDEVVPVLSRLYDTLALGRTGGIVRPESWWWPPVQRRLDHRDPVLAVVHSGADGRDDGFAIATPDDGDGFASRVLRLGDMHTADTDASAGLWRFLLGVDLVGTVEGSLRPLDEPLELLLADPRDCTVTGVDDETWLRLVDVPTALTARSYGDAEPVLLAVHDPFLEANAGVFRIGDGTAERVSPLGGVAPDLECDVTALAMAYLGDRAPSTLAAAGWWKVHDETAPTRADTLFATATVPWCGTHF